MAWQRDGLKWSQQLTEQCKGDMTLMLDRLDVRELLIHLGPLIMEQKGMTTEQWSVALAIGAGLASLEARRIEDTKAEITGVLRDYPSLLCTIEMEVREHEQVVLHIKKVHIELTGKD